MASILTRIFGSANERTLRRMWPIVRRINELEETFQGLPDEAFPEKTAEFREQLAGEDVTLEDILPEAFAAVREAARRTIGLRHYDVQCLGGIVLHRGQIAEMKTGEGKTLVATLALYLNALQGKGAHLVTVNDYLARRDVQWMGPVYHRLGVSVASIIHDQSLLFDPTYVPKDYRLLNLRPVERREAYRADITYGTNNEFGFDYLRDNMKFSLDEYVQRELHYAIVDEVDNILIDEARTPLIISGPAEDSTDKYYVVDRIIPRLRKEVDYAIDEKHRSATLTEDGISKCERLLGVSNLYDPNQIDMLHHVNQALKAHTLFKRDVDYVVKDGEVLIVDEFTGRLMPGRRWSDGLHQAVEAKEGVPIERENQTLATVTIQNYFRMYGKLAGMTGTADTEAVEFEKIYKLGVVVVPSNKPLRRVDSKDYVYRSEREKFDAVVEEIIECHGRGQPVLVGTTSVEKSERVSKLLKKAGIRHNVLNAINHDEEAKIIAQAGRFEQVTIATNMAGRGTDILLGGNPEFLARSDVEDQWRERVSRAGGKGGAGGERRAETTVRDMRERYAEEVQRIGAEHQEELDALDKRRSDALRELTDLHRRLLEESPYEKLRAEYEGRSSDDLMPALRGGAPIPPRYRQAKAAIEARLVAAAGDAALDADRGAFEELSRGYEAALEAWEEGGPRSEAAAREVDERRSRYERALADLELTLLTRGAAEAAQNGDLAEVRQAYQAAEQAYVEAERLHEERRAPYQEALRAAEQRFGAERAEYDATMAEVREQIEKAPQGYDADLLEKYRKTCVAEHEQVVAVGGLHILGTERHEARRIDNQLRGRGGRQGDPGSSRFYLSLEDDLLRIFGAERMQNIMEWAGMEEGERIEHRWIDRAIRNAQEKVEAHNFDIRKHLLEYDDVLNKQREVVYTRRREYLGREDLKEDVLEMVCGIAEDLGAAHADADTASEEWDWKALDDAVFAQFNLRLQVPEEERAGLRAEGLQELLVERVRAAYEERERLFGSPTMRYLERVILLQSLDTLWKDHLLSMDHLKEGIGLRGYGQVNPLQEYQKEGYALFEEMIARVESDVVEKMMSVQLRTEARVRQPQAAVQGGADEAGDVAVPAEIEAMQRRRRQAARMTLSRGGEAEPQKVETVRRDSEKVGRNDPCPCGSGKKYKKCHGRA